MKVLDSLFYNVTPSFTIWKNVSKLNSTSFSEQTRSRSDLVNDEIESAAVSLLHTFTN